jgi:hypothetical protein
VGHTSDGGGDLDPRTSKNVTVLARGVRDHLMGAGERDEGRHVKRGVP